MNLSVRMAGLCGTSVFLVTALPGFYRQIQPQDFTQMASDTFSGMAMLETLLLSLSGAIAAGFIGYIIGDIWAKPTGKRKKKVSAKAPVEKPQAVVEAPQPYVLEESAMSLSESMPPPVMDASPPLSPAEQAQPAPEAAESG